MPYASDADLVALLTAFIDSDPRLDIWRRYPDISEAEDDYTDTWACGQVSAEFAAFARNRGWDAAVVHADDPEHPLAFDHAWVRLTRDGVIDVDWTARQFHNLHVIGGHDPAVLGMPWPLAWDPAAVGADYPHPVAGPYDTITLENR